MKKILFACLLFLCFGSVNAAVVSLNFDTYNGSNLTDGQLLNDVYSDLDVTFNSTAQIHRTETNIHSLPNFAGGASDFTTSLELTFDNLATNVSAWNVGYSSFTLSVFDSLDQLLGSVFTNTKNQVSLSFANIKRAVFSTNELYGIDDLSFSTSAVSAVPVPAALFLFAPALMGFLGFRRKMRA